MGRTLQLDSDTPSKATHFGRYPANGEFTLLGLLLPKGQRNQLKDLQREHRRIIQIEGTFYSGRS